MLGRAGLPVGDMDLFEVNEPFSALMLHAVIAIRGAAGLATATLIERVES